jgi:hypothetical protein
MFFESMKNTVDLIMFFVDGVIIVYGNNRWYNLGNNNTLIIVVHWLKGGIGKVFLDISIWKSYYYFCIFVGFLISEMMDVIAGFGLRL